MKDEVYKLTKYYIHTGPKDSNIWAAFRRYFKTHNKLPATSAIYYGWYNYPPKVDEYFTLERTTHDGIDLTCLFQTEKVTGKIGKFFTTKNYVYKLELL